MAATMSLQRSAFYGSTRPFGAVTPRRAVAAHAMPVQAAIVVSRLCWEGRLSVGAAPPLPFPAGPGCKMCLFAAIAAAPRR